MDRHRRRALPHQDAVDQQQRALEERFPTWRITADCGGWQARHRTESHDPRRARAHVVSQIRRGSLADLADALLAQQALRGDGAEAVR